jgi:hypothetical protein
VVDHSRHLLDPFAGGIVRIYRGGKCSQSGTLLAKEIQILLTPPTTSASMRLEGAQRMEAVVLQTFICAACGWQIGALAEVNCPRCQKVMQAVPGTRRKKLCGHDDHAQCTIRCFATAEDVEGSRKKAAA